MRTRVLPLLVILSICFWSPPAGATPVQWSGNGHFYDVVHVGVTWDDAKLAAEASTFMGVPGHLATITSVAENVFLTETFGPSTIHFHWIGGFQPPGAPEPAGGWSWVTGEPLLFHNWSPGMPGEPNENSGVPGESENAMAFDHGVTANGKTWNDLPHTRILHGYVVEFAVPGANPCGAPTPCNCLGLDACLRTTGSVGEGACIGELSCADSSGDVAKGSCHDPEACSFNRGAIGERACHGLFACAENDGDIRKAGCIGTDACFANSGMVGEAACIGNAACLDNQGHLGKLSCRGDGACFERRGSLGENSCVGAFACQGSGPGAIGRGACHGDAACRNNPGPIAKGTCHGPPDPATGKGICEP